MVSPLELLADRAMASRRVVPGSRGSSVRVLTTMTAGTERSSICSNCGLNGRPLDGDETERERFMTVPSEKEFHCVTYPPRGRGPGRGRLGGYCPVALYQ